MQVDLGITVGLLKRIRASRQVVDTGYAAAYYSCSRYRNAPLFFYHRRDRFVPVSPGSIVDFDGLISLSGLKIPFTVGHWQLSIFPVGDEMMMIDINREERVLCTVHGEVVYRALVT